MHRVHRIHRIASHRASHRIASHRTEPSPSQCYSAGPSSKGYPCNPQKPVPLHGANGVGFSDSTLEIAGITFHDCFAKASLYLDDETSYDTGYNLNNEQANEFMGVLVEEARLYDGEARALQGSVLPVVHYSGEFPIDGGFYLMIVMSNTGHSRGSKVGQQTARSVGLNTVHSRVHALLDKLHGAGITHGDMGLRNVNIQENGTVRLVDFGMVSLDLRQCRQDHESFDADVTGDAFSKADDYDDDDNVDNNGPTFDVDADEHDYIISSQLSFLCDPKAMRAVHDNAVLRFSVKGKGSSTKLVIIYQDDAIAQLALSHLSCDASVMIQDLQKYSKYLLFDATHNVITARGFKLFSIFGIDDKGAGVELLYVLIRHETVAVCERVFAVLANLHKDPDYKPQCVMCDMAKGPITAMHRMWQLTTHSTLVLVKSIEAVKGLLRDTDEEALKFFVDNYFADEEKVLWSAAHRRGNLDATDRMRMTNMICEAWHSVLKTRGGVAVAGDHLARAQLGRGHGHEPDARAQLQHAPAADARAVAAQPVREHHGGLVHGGAEAQLRAALAVGQPALLHAHLEAAEVEEALLELLRVVG
ncbi:Cell division protein kinase 2, putative [Hondaea fermentalgiana]|uniref:Cell division protein kinase 2, putative n=1 Tax=Hondaea fermentalgiana TaxID=2315210 RepID=A0A2R5GS99_9STRA|nr:Cell division protein kinase 2, putative [Hondaea fermentalgiana]|eukprot:GBG33757.1 Cell division protein kinase 2, putative [Hondaea fermentalgiana]